jgi:hypothetical protein
MAFSQRCHACREEAVGRCYNCGSLYCEKHGGQMNCLRCEVAVMAGDPRPDRISAVPLSTAPQHAWWRPQLAEDFEPTSCYACPGLAHRRCRHCGSFYCSDHAGPKGLCAACRDSSRLGLIVLIATSAALGALLVWGIFAG